MAMHPAIARQNRRGVWLYKRPLRRHISDFFSSATKTLPRWLFADAEICCWNASAAGLDLLQRPACRFGLSPDAIRKRSKRASLKELISARRCCKCCTINCKTCRTPLHADDTYAEGMSCLGESRDLWRKNSGQRIRVAGNKRAHVGSGWVRCRASLPTHGYRMEG